MTDDIIAGVRRELASLADETAKISLERFFKEEVKTYGVKTPLVNRLAARLWKDVKPLAKTVIFALCEELYKSDYMEEAFIANEWAYNCAPRYEPADFITLERWLNEYVNNWAKCDGLCNHAVGDFIVKFPEFMPDLKRWTASPNLWVRRGAAVSLIVPARRGMFLEDVLDIAGRLLTDTEDLVQKGYGWMLKAAAEAHQREVFDYVMERRSTMPRTALRYAIEKMPPELKEQAMKKAFHS